MIMKVPKLLLLYALVFLFASAAGRGQTTDIEQKGVVVSRALAGHVDFQPTKLPAKGVTVELCSPDWQTVLASTKTDENGYFSMEKPKLGKLFYLRLSASGVNPYKLRVRVKKHGPHELTIHLSVA